MKKSATAALLIAASLTATAQDTGSKIEQRTYALPQCVQPVAKVVVGKLSCKSAGCREDNNNLPNDGLGVLARIALANQEGGSQQTFPGAGEGMSAMLTTTLKATGCFDIQEREALEELSKELALVGKKVEVEQAEFMISGSITSMNMSTEKKSFGGGFIPILGHIGVTTKTADVGLDIKLIDVARAKVLDSKTFEANNETSSTSFGAAGFGGGALLGGSLSGMKNTPMEPIIRDVLAQVASYTAHHLMTVKGVAIPAPAAATVTPAPAVATPVVATN